MFIAYKYVIRAFVEKRNGHGKRMLVKLLLVVSYGKIKVRFDSENE